MSAYSKVTVSEQFARGVLWVQGEISRLRNQVLKIC